MARNNTGTIGLEGLETLQENLKRVVELYNRKKVKQMLRPAANVVAKAIRSRAPVRTKPAGGVKKYEGSRTYYPGNLKLGIKVATYPKSSSLFVLPKLLKGSAAKEVQAVGDVVTSTGDGATGGAKSDPYYAHMVEFGTSHSAPNPFMRNGFAASEGAAIKKLEQTLTKALAKTKFKKP